MNIAQNLKKLWHIGIGGRIVDLDQQAQTKDGFEIVAENNPVRNIYIDFGFNPMGPDWISIVVKNKEWTLTLIYNATESGTWLNEHNTGYKLVNQKLYKYNTGIPDTFLRGQANIGCGTGNNTDNYCDTKLCGTACGKSINSKKCKMYAWEPTCKHLNTLFVQAKKDLHVDTAYDFSSVTEVHKIINEHVLLFIKDKLITR